MARFFKEVGRRLHLVGSEEQVVAPVVNSSHSDHNRHSHKQHYKCHHHHHHHHHNHHHNHHGKWSDNEEEGGAASSRTVITPQQLEEYKKLAQKAWDILWTYVQMDDNEWSHETGKTLQEGIIHSYATKEFGKIFRLQGQVDMDAKSIWEEMVFNINTSPQWNPSLLECNTVMVIDNNTDISHNIAAGIGGIVSSRDFVNIRHWGKREGLYLSAGHGVTHPDCPPSKKHTRGFNGPGGWAFRPIPGESNSCIFTWYMNIDLKGWIPQRAVDQAASTVLRDYLKHVRQYVQTLRVRA